ncbi:hypothetical protein Cgig2_006655 [Carnegiea gigantea]|uniref:Uncharacterized protein n=1 Tax=Carnegiea gigantea TaxID=171969 RepID=A0A9Q1GQ41_9CARY|nr:hypothetical protein Cgig2_006655 [Carnegiea gigantea]
MNALHGRDAKRIIETKQALRKAHNSDASYQSATTPYTSKSRGVGWYEEQDESSRTRYSKIQKLNQVIATKELNPLVGPTMTFGPKDICPMQIPHIEALVIQLKIAIAMVRRILINTRSSIDIYTENNLEAVEISILGLRDKLHIPWNPKDYLSELATKTAQEM